MALEMEVERLIGFGGFGPVSFAEVVLGQCFADQLFFGFVAAGGDLIDEGLE